MSEWEKIRDAIMGADVRVSTAFGDAIVSRPNVVDYFEFMSLELVGPELALWLVRRHFKQLGDRVEEGCENPTISRHVDWSKADGGLVFLLSRRLLELYREAANPPGPLDA